ncbi:MAG TPA: tripartite tricarboxylate transporter substrate-binding protein [Xanthobacteraceae bacterium]|nr:tripartite tricarboxylate transporter substrate-binding protein [Xanthobacteraceae bacterium]
MRRTRRDVLKLGAAAATLPLVAPRAWAQAYPAKPVRLIVGFPAGGQVDIIARLFGQWFGERLGQAVVVENKPGAGGNLGAQAVINAAPDGYTLFFAAASNTVNTTLFADLPYDFARDTTPVGPVNRIPLVLEVNPTFAANTVADLIAYAKANPGKLSVGSPSAGTPPYLAVELLKMVAGIDIVHVPYFGENQMITDLLGAQLLAGLGGISSGIGHFRAGKLRALGVTTAARIPELPDVPAVGETIAGFEASGWSGVVAPKGTPKAVVDTLAAAIAAVQADAKFKERLTEFGAPLFSMPPDAFGKFIVAETEKWGKVVKFAGLKPP